MNREIKFRVWSDLKQQYLKYIDAYSPHFLQVAISTSDGSEWLHARSKKLTIEQYTGLKDKNGVEIYEGDYVKIAKHRWCLVNGQREEDAQYLVEWSGIGFDFNLLNGSFMQGCGRDSEPEYEVVGNIHEGIFKDNAEVCQPSDENR